MYLGFYKGIQTTSTQSLTRPRPATRRNRVLTSTSSAVGVPTMAFSSRHEPQTRWTGREIHLHTRLKPRRTTCYHWTMTPPVISRGEWCIFCINPWTECFLLMVENKSNENRYYIEIPNSKLLDYVWHMGHVRSVLSWQFFEEIRKF